MPLVLLLVIFLASNVHSQDWVHDYFTVDTLAAENVSRRDSTALNFMNWRMSIELGHDGEDSLLVSVSDCVMDEKSDSLIEPIKHIRSSLNLRNLVHYSDFYKIEIPGLTGYVQKKSVQTRRAELYDIVSHCYPVWIAGRDKGVYHIDPDNLADPLKMRDLNQKGQIPASVSRRFDNAIEEKLLCTAEAAYPPPFRSLLHPSAPGDTVLITASDRVDPKRDWWCGRYGPYLIPATITKDAVTYFLRFSGKEYSVEWSEENQFEYEADIVPLQDGPVGRLILDDACLVSMKLDLLWRDTDIWRQRYVVLNSNGDILITMGDSLGPVMTYLERIQTFSGDTLPNIPSSQNQSPGHEARNQE
jgi:hypothetical protein